MIEFLRDCFCPVLREVFEESRQNIQKLVNTDWVVKIGLLYNNRDNYVDQIVVCQ